jgi:putative Mg2+ transporter-C (MgtC) family protein
MFIETEHIIQICAAFTAGGLMGLEREYRSKPAGFRTIILITVGSCLISILSTSFANNSDRIASNIVTGIGFIGAGVVFKEGANIRGITSAATIWMAAAIGMCIGFKFYGLALLVVVLVLGTLIILSKLEEWFDSFRQEKEYVINFKSDSYSLHELESELKKMHIYFVRYKFVKHPQEVAVYYKIVTRKIKYEKLNLFLLNNSNINSFEV